MEELTELERWIIIISIIVFAGFIHYQFKKKHLNIEKKLNKVIREDIKESQDISLALVSLHYGKYRQALMKLKLVAIDNPDRDDIKNAISELQRFINNK